MAGRKVFAVQSILQSADVNGYLMDQTVPRFTTTTQRDGQWPSPPDGAQCVTVDTFTRWFRKNGVWQPTPATLAYSEHGIFPNLNSGSLGTFDLYSTANTVTPYPCKIICSLICGMTGAGAASFNASMVRLDTGAAFPATGTTYCQATYWSYVSYAASWLTTAGAGIGAKGRITVVGSGGSTVGTAGSITLQAFAI